MKDADADAGRQARPDDDVLVIRLAEAESVDRGEGISTTYLVTPARGVTTFVNGITELEPGASLPFHFHDCEESVIILSGCASFESTEGAFELHPGDSTLVSAGAVHRFVNPGETKLRVFFTYGSASPNRTWVDSGETAAIGSASDRP